MFAKTRIIIGILLWLAVITVAGLRFATDWIGSDSAASRSLAEYAFKPRTNWDLKFQYRSVVRIGDPVFFEHEDGRLVQVGALRQVDSPESRSHNETYANWASVTFFSSAPNIEAGDYLTSHETPNSMDWVARYLFPPSRRQEIARLITKVYAEHSQEIMRDLMPILQDAWDEISIIVRDELVESIRKRQPEFERLGVRFREEIVEKDLIPLINEEVWPLVQVQAQPLLEQVGEQIWQRASIWGFGWRAIYDASPLPRRDLTKQEFSRFLENEAMPIIVANLPRFFEAQQVVLEQLVQNPRVIETLRRSLIKIGSDTELQTLMLDVLRETLFENPRLANALRNIWRRPDLQRVLELTDRRMEPTVVRIGESVFGSPYYGVTPEFARILRNKILLKDRRWLILHKADDSAEAEPLIRDNQDPDTLIVLRGSSTMENPFYYPARDRKR
ncbi:MAG: hypothetical protein ACR2NP_08550 [Pirellulaceae bacterium]